MKRRATEIIPEALRRVEKGLERDRALKSIPGLAIPCPVTTGQQHTIFRFQFSPLKMKKILE